MNTLPKILTLSPHAKQRLKERSNGLYNTCNLMDSGCEWYTMEDIPKNSGLYAHSTYVIRKAKSKLKYITDGTIEVLYDTNTNVAITIMEVKEKFLSTVMELKNKKIKGE